MITPEQKSKLQDLMNHSVTMGEMQPEAIKILESMAYGIAERQYRIPAPDRQAYADKAIRDIKKIWKQFNPQNQNAASFFQTSIKMSIVEAQRNGL